METVEEWAKTTQQFARYIATAPARMAMAEARKKLIEAASVFYMNGCKENGDRMKALADQLPRTDW